MRHRVPLFTALSCIVLAAACRESSQRVFIRTGAETSLVDHGDVASVSLPITLESRFSGNVVTTGVGLQILAQVDSPVVDGVTLQATDAQWVGDRVYAAYNVRGNTFSGAIQIIDVSSPETPVVLAEAIFPNTDIARIVVCGSTILAAGADEGEGATLEWFTLQGEELSVGGYQALGSHSATYVSVDGNRAYVSFGDSQGGAAVFDIGGEEPVELRSVDRFDARWVGEADDHDLLLLSGSPGLLERFEGGADGESADMQDVVVPGAGVGAPTWAQRANDLLYVSADQEGMIVFDLRGLEVAGVLDTDGDANGLVLAADRRLAFLANGDAGLAVVDVSDAGQPELLASIDVSDDRGSANAVAASGEHLALADGLGGVKIIHYAREQDVGPEDCDDDGVPDEQDSDDDDDGVLDEDDGSDCNPDLVCGEGEVHVVGSFFGNFYNLPCDHPDVEGPITGVVRGTRPDQFDWFDREYFAFSVERETLIIDYAENYFPVDEGLCGDPFHFAAHWQTTAIATEDGTYRIELGSDDDSWLIVDGQIVIDLGGIHAIHRESALVELTRGPHRFEVYFAERHVVQSGLEFEVVGFPSESARLEMVQHRCLDAAGDEDGDGVPNAADVAPFEPTGYGF